MEVSRIVSIQGLSDTELAVRLKSLNISLTPDEARRIARKLERDPSIVELFIFSIEWSEHCSYKSSRRILKKYLPVDGTNVILGPGEDAGIVSFTSVDGVEWAIVIGHESHNHPSQLLPVEGAATGIGGIVRDVDCMGAHVCAAADSLRFGDPNGINKARTRWIAAGVVDGIWQYGNALGVPNLCGEVYYDESFDDNCLVNVIALGIIPASRIVRSRVPQGHPELVFDLVLVGKPTDASGFGGVTFASEILDQADEERRLGAVQVHDPFLKNILIMRKANKMVLDRAFELGIPIGMKDLGGGGLACASSEICAAGGFGAEIHLDRVHIAVENLPPEVIACGETQERFILAVPEHFTPEVLRIYNQTWNLPVEANGACARIIGRAVPGNRYRIFFHDELVCDAPVEEITSGIQYHRSAEPIVFKGCEPDIQSGFDPFQALKKLIGSVNGASRFPVFRHYDTEVQGAAVIRPGEADAGVIAPLELINGSSAAIVLSVDGNPFIGEVDPYWSGAVAVAESMRNVIACGGIPRALTDCLNFGNPEKPPAFWQFEESVRGIADAATNLWQPDQPGLPVPIVSGNVSFYNESALGKAIKPSPIVACLGVMEDYSRAVTMHFKDPGNPIVCIGERRNEMGGSAYFRDCHHVTGTKPLTVDFESERKAMHAVISLIQDGFVAACHDIADGGLAVALAEMCLSVRKGVVMGADIQIPEPDIPPDRFLFSETGGFIVEIPADCLEPALKIISKCGIWYSIIGKTQNRPFIDLTAGPTCSHSMDLHDLLDAWKNGLEEVQQ